MNQLFNFIAVPFGWIMRGCYWLAGGNYIIALFFFSLIIEIFMLLLFGIRQQKNSIKAARLKPKEMAIRKKYAGRTDQPTQQKMMQEIQAMQQKEGYGPLKLRSALVPVVNLGSNLYFPIFLLGILFSWEPLIYVGIACFSLTLLFSLVTLPVEFNASSRAIAALRTGGYLSGDELDGAKAVLNAAALTYVASAVSSLLQLIRLLLIARRNDRD